MLRLGVPVPQSLPSIPAECVCPSQLTPASPKRRKRCQEPRGLLNASLEREACSGPEARTRMQVQRGQAMSPSAWPCLRQMVGQVLGARSWAGQKLVGICEI